MDVITALQNVSLQTYAGAQPAKAEATPTGTLLCTITNAAGAVANEVLATGTLTLTGGAAGSINTVSVNSAGILDAAGPFNTSLTQTAADLAAATNNSTSSPEYSATSAGAVVTITAQRETGAGPNGHAVAATVTTITTSDTPMEGGVAPVNGLKFGYSAGGVLVKHPTQVWAGVAVNTGTAGWFRFIGSVADTGVIDSTESQVRIDGNVATSGGQLNMSSTAITSGATQTISSFPLTLPSS